MLLNEAFNATWIFEYTTKLTATKQFFTQLLSLRSLEIPLSILTTTFFSVRHYYLTNLTQSGNPADDTKPLLSRPTSYFITAHQKLPISSSTHHFLYLPPTPQPKSSNTLKMATSVASRRLFSEYRALTSSPPEGITAGPVSEDDIFTWEALIQGPDGTPYEGGVFPAELKFPKDYPLAPPTMKFLGEVWHPNG